MIYIISINGKNKLYLQKHYRVLFEFQRNHCSDKETEVFSQTKTQKMFDFA